MNQVPIIFLDIDGVFNHQLYFVNTPKGNRSNIDKESVAIFNDMFVVDVPPKVVITSTWRLNTDVDEFKTLFEKEGFKFSDQIIGRTDSLHGECYLRGNEIYKWIRDNPIECGGVEYYNYDRYVIFDDDSDMLYWQRNNYINIDAYCGLTPSNVYKAKKILRIKDLKTK